MMDMLKSRGLEIDVQKMEHLLGMPIVPISASRGKGVRELIDRTYHEGVEHQETTLSPFDEERLPASTSCTAGMLILSTNCTIGAITTARNIYPPM